MDDIRTSSTPSINEFDPTIIKSQIEVINLIRTGWDYEKYGVLEVLLSGSVGSSKSLNMAHVGLTHVLGNPGAGLLIGRKSMPDLKDTIFRKILEHLEDSYFSDGTKIEKDKHYWVNETRASIKFFNKSIISSRSWGDKKYKKFRSQEYSAALIEELTENDSEEFSSFYPEMKARVGRLPHVRENFILCATNPDGPSHDAYDYFIGSPRSNRKVFYSVTTDNPFLEENYINGLLETYTKDEARRMIYGEWLDLKTEVIYYAYNEDKVVFNEQYEVNPLYPICLTHDFNIGVGKPMSAVAFQFIDGIYYFFMEFVVKGARTADIIEEAIGKGLFDAYCPLFIIRGDASGQNRSTNYNKTDYEVIEKILENHINCRGEMIDIEIDVPSANPAVRTRHVIVNGLLESAKGTTKIQVHSSCEVLREGLRKSKLKEGASYIEDDSKPYQHITTAMGYGIMSQISYNGQQEANIYKTR